jgi:hypothetical protein
VEKILVDKKSNALGGKVVNGELPNLLSETSQMTSYDNGQELLKHIERLEQSIRDLDSSIDLRVRDALLKRMYVPSLLAPDREHGKFMPYSTCSSADFFHPRYAQICKLINVPPIFNRKMWEWTFIIHKLQEAGMLVEGKRGIAFGVGKEKLPALFCSLGASIVATDAPDDIGLIAGWNAGNQYSNSLEQLRYREIVSDEVFDLRVTHRSCDMNAISSDLVDFDFTWSSCCFEHLGSLEAGIQFVINSVEKTLKVGGVACHTTEFNLSSEDETMEEGPTVIYRRKDIVELVNRLRARGHDVEPFIMAPDSHFLDFYVDAPPFGSNPHFKLLLGKYVATSVGVVVRRR